MARFASVFPLVTARALDRPFTYAVEDDVEKGAVVRVRFGGRRVRGVVVEVSDEAPEGIDAKPVEAVVDSGCRRRSSTSRSGSPTTTARRTARALALVAPRVGEAARRAAAARASGRRSAASPRRRS